MTMWKRSAACAWLAWAGLASAATTGVEAQMSARSLTLEFEPAMAIFDNAPVRAVSVSPAVPMTCTWTDDHTLDCAADRGHAFPQATGFDIRIAPGLHRADGAALGGIRLQAETDRPSLDARIVDWTDGRPVLRIEPELPTTAEAIARVLELRAGDRVWRALDVAALPPPTSPWERPAFRVALPPDLPSDTVVAVHMRAGLVSTAGPLPSTTERTLLRFHNDEAFAIRSAACTARTPDDGEDRDPTDGLALRCVAGEDLRLSFSAAPDAAGKAAFAARLPPSVRVVGWDTPDRRWWGPDVLQSAPGATVRLRAEAANTDIAFNVDATLHDAAGRALVRPVAIRIRNGAALPTLAAAGSRTLFGDGDRALVAAMNAPTLAIGETRLGLTGDGARFRLPATRNGAGAFTSKGANATLAEHGWVRWRAQAAANATLDFAAPAFDLSAQVSRTEVLVWAVDWRDSRPVAGADVELVLVAADGDAQVHARARIGDDGLARLTLPPGFVLPRTAPGAISPTWVVRARAGGRLAVLPLDDVVGHGEMLGQPRGERRLFAVADRPLYRAGDTLRFRAWLRERRGGRLVVPGDLKPFALQLRRPFDDQSMAEVAVSPDAEGAFTGELALPSQLPDGDYCLAPADGDWKQEAGCVFVGTFRAQDLWIDARTETSLLRAGDPLRLRIEAGYWSGGAAAGVAISEVKVRATQASPADAYPLFAGYVFTGNDSGAAAPGLRETARAWPALDADGKAGVDVPVAFAADDEQAPPAFARIEATAQIALSGREPVASAPAVAWQARFARYVGLKLDPGWFGATTPLRFDAVVVDAAGHAQAGAPVEVVVDYVGGDETAPPQRVASCILAAGTPAPCAVPRSRSGHYRFTARSGDAAPATIERYVWNASDDQAPDQTLRSLTVVEAPARADAPVRLRLQQPYARADAWVVLSADGEALDSRIVPLDGPDTTFLLPTRADGRNRIDVVVRVRERRAAGVDARGLRDAPGALTLSADIDVPRPAPVARLALDAPTTRTAPGATVRLRLHNTGASPRTVALAVFDDALRALAGERWDAFDPQGEDWLDAREASWLARFRAAGFGDWCRCGWRRVLSWEDGKPAARFDGEETSPIVSINRTHVESQGRASLDDVLFGLRVRDRDASEGVPAPGRAQTGFGELFGYVGGADDGQLDTVVVTGSRLEGDPFEIAAAPRPDPTLSIDPAASDRAATARPTPTAEARALFGARVRDTFAETALWQPALVLAPDESREIELVAPDNLTRWRAVAWTADAGEAFERVEATFEVGQPVEVRLQAPVRVYPDDRAVLVANVRHEGAAATADAVLRVDALGAANQRPLPLAANGQDALSLAIAPTDRDRVPGTLAAVAAARTDAGVDATAQAIELASPTIDGHRTQAGWLGASPLRLAPPALPAGATDVRLRVALLPGGDALAHGWIDALERYPHRCWEQTLSRAVAAAIALERGEGERFPEAQATIDDALRNAPVFQNEDGSFRYFADSEDRDEHLAQVPLTAWSVRALGLLETLGHAVPAQVLEEAKDFLGDAIDGAIDDLDDDNGNDDTQAVAERDVRLALAAATRDAPSRAVGDRLWARFATLPLPAQTATVRVLANAAHPQARAAVEAVLARAQRRDDALRLHAVGRLDRWMSSDAREQCELIGVLRERPALADAATRRRLIAGLGDLYAGGVDGVDTQAAANCLIALRGLDAGSAQAQARLDVAQGAQRIALALTPGAPPPSQVQSIEARDVRQPLRLTPRLAGNAPASFVLDYAWREDARRAASSAAGFALQRHYAALRDGDWVPLADAALRDGDWVRVTLVLDNAATRHFVAITDAVPGGLRPTDLSLSGVAGIDVQRVSDTGDGWFATRRLDPRAPKFYAEFLPPGRHEVHYFARVGNAGDYLAPPAAAELMYGEATRARTAASRIVIAPVAGTP